MYRGLFKQCAFEEHDTCPQSIPNEPVYDGADCLCECHGGGISKSIPQHWASEVERVKQRIAEGQIQGW